MKDDNCIFCKLANGEIPTRSIYEDEHFQVFLDAAPATRGHALIVPKDHYQNIYELPEHLAAKTLVLAKKLATGMTERLSCDGFHLLQNNGEAAGQTVFHFHLHLIPRYRDDENTGCLAWQPLSLSDTELDEIQNRLSAD